MVIKPLLGNPLQLAEQRQFGVLVWLAPVLFEETLREMKEKRGSAEVTGMDERKIDALADDTLISCNGRTDELRC